MAAADPYSSIKDELDAELQIINGLQAKLFAGHPEAAPQLRSHLSNVQEQLRALEAAVKLMVDHPARFQLDSTTAFMRQVNRVPGMSMCTAVCRAEQHVHAHVMHYLLPCPASAAWAAACRLLLPSVAELSCMQSMLCCCQAGCLKVSSWRCATWPGHDMSAASMLLCAFLPVVLQNRYLSSRTRTAFAPP